MTASKQALLAQLEDAVRDERDKRLSARDAGGRVGTVVRELMKLGIPSVKLAARVAKTLGLPLDLKARRRLAARLRKRASRVNRCHGIPVSAPGSSPSCAVPSISEETPMPKPQMIEETTTTVTKKYIEEPEVDAEDDLDDENEDDLDDEDDDGEGERPEKATRARRRQK